MQRSFTLEDQISFAQLSGDYNPLHVDPIASRRSIFGGVIVHGVHTLLWALNEWVSDIDLSIELKDVSAVFRNPVQLGKSVRVFIVNRDASSVELEVRQGDTLNTRIQAQYRRHIRTGIPLGLNDNVSLAEESKDLNEEEISSSRGRVPIVWKEEITKKLFPDLANTLPKHQLAIILSTTYLVGMECPGLHSIFSELNLEFSLAQNTESYLHYHTSKYFAVYKMLLLSIQGSGFEGSIKAFLRPKPYKQPAFSEIQEQTPKEAFSTQRAIIIGGSRGLGEVVGKTLAAGGAEVMITYNKGHEDAKRVCEDIECGGGRASYIQYDVLDPKAHLESQIKLMDPLSHLYYFASPRIESSPKGNFSSELFNIYSAFYVTGFKRAIQSFLPLGLKGVFYPSTIFLDSLPEDFIEYTTAKSAGEIFCETMTRHRNTPIFWSPRLPKMKTDQVVGITTTEGKEPLPVLLDKLIQFHKLFLQSSTI